MYHQLGGFGPAKLILFSGSFSKSPYMCLTFGFYNNIWAFKIMVLAHVNHHHARGNVVLGGF